MCAAAVAALRKGANVTLSALADELGSVSAMLEWGVERGRRLDADVSAVLIGDDGRARSNDDLVFYNQKAGGDGAVRLRGKVSFEAERFTGFADVIEDPGSGQRARGGAGPDAAAGRRRARLAAGPALPRRRHRRRAGAGTAGDLRAARRAGWR
ncbi:TerD family protein [Pseudofrankia sp. DC12]|uniref:TerD family protein n=1 Tax=Pseudofrankia sp. DC12 TaxID=683315 RepID=UPI0005F807B4|nr:TerD family protein [Pseudofrankia sp. DC12]